MYGGYQQPQAGPSNGAPIPAPVPKADYAAPVFQTFQERKRLKEAALRASIEPIHPSYSTPPRITSHSPSLPNIQQNPARPLPSPRPSINVDIRIDVPTSHPSSPPSIQLPGSSQPTIRFDVPSFQVDQVRNPVEATLERSDTLASVRSLDRHDFGSARRPLPKPPVNVNSSRSLDRGIQARRQPSDIQEEEEPRLSPIPSINIPETPGIVVTAIPTISVTTDIPSPIRLQADSDFVCATCGESIIGRIVNAMKKRFHPHCFKCETCSENLEHVSSYEWEGKAYCHLDYHDKFAHQCKHCQTPIVDSTFITLNDDDHGQRYYHLMHFFCAGCGDPFLDPSKADAEETNAFVIHRGYPYCERCHIRLHKPKCKGCKKPIPDVAVNAMGAKWHTSCFLCSTCGKELNNLFFPKDGQPLCTSCWEDA